MPRRTTVLSIVTLGWVVALLWVGITQTRGTWPVARSTMFSHSAVEHVELVLTGTTTDGRRLVLGAEGFGLSAPQLRNWLAQRTGGEIDDTDRPVLALLARLWTDAHPADELTAVDLATRTTSLARTTASAGPGPVTTEPQLRWSADDPAP